MAKRFILKMIKYTSFLTVIFGAIPLLVWLGKYTFSLLSGLGVDWGLLWIISLVLSTAALFSVFDIVSEDMRRVNNDN